MTSMTIPSIVEPSMHSINKIIEFFENEKYGKLSIIQKNELKKLKNYLNNFDFQTSQIYQK